eukprot:XP_022260988.1 anoctamin-9 isoform X1 [Canis lupus familiaris]
MGTEGDSFPLMEVNTGDPEASEPWDYVLVADRRGQRATGQAHRQLQFLEKLKRKGFRYKMMEDGEKVFFGIRAESRIFDLYRTLLMESEGPGARTQPAGPAPIPASTRIRIVNFVLNNTTAAGDTLDDLVKSGVFETRFVLHKGQDDLRKEWAQWRRVLRPQPIDDIRDYFGEKVALYFAWLGWYTYMLVPAAAVGLLVFLSGFALFNASQISKEICEAHDILLCPRGDHSRRYQQLSDTCTFAKLTHLFDNEGTVVFAIFMALWGECRRAPAGSLSPGAASPGTPRPLSAPVRSHRVPGDLEAAAGPCGPALGPVRLGRGPGGDGASAHQPLRLPAAAAPALLPEEQRHPHPVCAHDLPHDRHGPPAGGLPGPGRRPLQLHPAVPGRAGDHGCGGDRRPVPLCGHPHHDQEKPRTFSERESKFTTKFFTLQFFAHFSSLIYIAFILGRINGHPGKSVRLAGLWKLEECHLSGCMMDLFLQMAIIMGLKQTLSNCAEYLGPWLAYKCRLMRFKLGRASGDPELRDMQHNYLLNPVNTFSLFDEFMEMMIQYGFTTIFVAAFPLAPLLALISNLVEIRLDAIKMVRLQRRLVPRKAKDIGTWLQVLETIGVLAVIANGMVIAFTSEFIPRVVYKYHYGPCRLGAQPAVDCLTGYVNHSLSVFYTKDFQDPVQAEGSENITECRYRDYRDAQDYSLSEQFWVLLAIRLLFLILFELQLQEHRRVRDAELPKRLRTTRHLPPHSQRTWGSPELCVWGPRGVVSGTLWSVRAQPRLEFWPPTHRAGRGGFASQHTPQEERPVC